MEFRATLAPYRRVAGGLGARIGSTQPAQAAADDRPGWGARAWDLQDRCAARARAAAWE